MILQMSTEELLALPVAVDLTTAGRAFGVGRTKAYELARAGLFPCPVLMLGAKFRVAKADILRVLKVDQNNVPGDAAGAA